MKREVYGPLGLLMVLMGVTLTAAMNVWFVPELVAKRSHREHAGKPAGSCPPSVTVVVPSVAADKPDAASDAAVADAQADAFVDSAADVLEDGSAELDANDAESADVSSAVIRFEAGKTTLTRELTAQIETVAAQLRHNFGLKVVLVGYGDDPANSQEYVKVGRSRAVAVMRSLIDYGVSAARIAFESPILDGGVVEGTSGTVGLKLVPRFAEGGEKHVP